MTNNKCLALSLATNTLIALLLLGLNETVLMQAMGLSIWLIGLGVSGAILAVNETSAIGSQTND